MVVKKYNTFEEAERDIWQIKPDQRYCKHIFALFHMSQFKSLFKCPRGIFRYKTIEEAQADVEKWLKSDGNR